MATVVSATEVCNLALDLLKNDAITDIVSPEVGNATVMARWYDPVRRATLRKHPWNFAIKRANLAADATPPEFGYSAAFVLPTDNIRLLTVGDIAVEDLAGRFELEDSRILFNSDGALAIRYIYDHVNVPLWDALFVDVMAAELALRTCYKITGDKEMIPVIKAHLKEIAPEAYAIDGQERPPRRRQVSRWLRARRGGSSGLYSGPIMDMGG